MTLKTVFRSSIHVTSRVASNTHVALVIRWIQSVKMSIPPKITDSNQTILLKELSQYFVIEFNNVYDDVYFSREITTLLKAFKKRKYKNFGNFTQATSV